MKAGSVFDRGTTPKKRYPSHRFMIQQKNKLPHMPEGFPTSEWSRAMQVPIMQFFLMLRVAAMILQLRSSLEKPHICPRHEVQEKLVFNPTLSRVCLVQGSKAICIGLSSDQPPSKIKGKQTRSKIQWQLDTLAVGPVNVTENNLGSDQEVHRFTLVPFALL